MNHENIPIAVIGAGALGTALALRLARNPKLLVRLCGHQESHVLRMVQERVNPRYFPQYPFPDRLTACVHWSDAFVGVRDVIIAVPSHAFSEALERMAPYIHSSSRVLWGTKGLVGTRCPTTLDQIVLKRLGPRAIAALSGPGFADDIAAHAPIAMSLACSDASFAQTITEYFAHSSFLLQHTTDLMGVQLCGVIKNILAIAVGICRSLNMCESAIGASMTWGLEECATLMHCLGGKKETLLGLSGLGDLFLSTTPQSRNYQLGLLLGQGMSLAEGIQKLALCPEGAQNAPRLRQLSRQYKLSVPMLETINAILEGKDSQTEWNDLLHFWFSRAHPLS